MAFDFPNSPTIGQQFQAGTVTWQWDGTAWNIVPLITPPIADDDPPANPYPGQLWWNARNGNLYVWYDDGNSAQWVQTAGNSGQVRTAQTRNRIVNGDMAVSQENGDTVGNVSGYHPADQWIVGSTLTGMSIGRSGTNVPQIGLSGTLASIVAGSVAHFQQGIEGGMVKDFLWGLPTAQPVVLRFDAYSGLAGTFTAAIRNAAADRSFLAPFTLPATTWTTVEIAIPGCTDGTWPLINNLAMLVSIVFAVGSTYGGGVAGWQTGSKIGIAGMSNGYASSNACYIRKVGLYLDPDNTGKAPPWQNPDDGEELARCQRYWQYLGVVQMGQADGLAQAQVTFPVTMRVPPVVTATGTASWTAMGVGGARQTAAGTFGGSTLKMSARLV